jgi:hypothetical protein
MKNAAPYIAIVVSLLLLPVGATLGHRMSPDDCDVGKDPNLSGRNVKQQPDFDFRWESSASLKPVNGIWCYDRYVQNRHTRNALRFDWPAAGLTVVEGLPQGETAHYNFGWQSGPPESRGGDLSYGADSVEKTKVYLTPEETAHQPNRNAVSGAIRMVVFDERKNRVRIFLTLTATAQSRIKIEYGIMNRGDPVQMDWELSRSPAFYGPARVELDKRGKHWEFGSLMPVPEGNLRIDVATLRAGTARSLPIRFYSDQGKEIARVRILTIVTE